MRLVHRKQSFFEVQRGCSQLELIEGEKELILESIDEIFKTNDRTRENLIPILQQAQEK